MPALCLYQPDIPQNVGSLMRLSACMGVGLHIIEPCGFPLGDKAIKRVAMDYAEQADITRHVSWNAFLAAKGARRLVLVEAREGAPYTQFSFQSDDLLLLGRESAGVPQEVVAACDASVHIPMQTGFRSLNVALAASMVLGEALRQGT